jgi:prepilin-type N-terminal cleavage/methylation domain-containing protein
MKRNKKGFTLIELMIVVAIIAIIAAIAIPNLLRSRMSANEAGAAGAMRTISSSEAAFQTACIVTDPATGIGQYGDLAELADDTAGEPFIDNVLGAGAKHGYTFVATPVDDPAAPTYTAVANPANANSGRKNYFVDESGVIRFALDAAADATSPPLN